MELIFKIASIGMLVAILNILLAKSGREDQAFMVNVAGIIIALMLIVPEILQLFELIRRVFSF